MNTIGNNIPTLPVLPAAPRASAPTDVPVIKVSAPQPEAVEVKLAAPQKAIEIKSSEPIANTNVLGNGTTFVSFFDSLGKLVTRFRGPDGKITYFPRDPITEVSTSANRVDFKA
jgi:hypothetical protein